MAVYPIKDTGKSRNTKYPTRTWNTEEFIRKGCDFYLTDEAGHRYRLHAKNAPLVDNFLPYDVLCPKCHNVMRCGPKTLYELGLYECKCSKY